MKKTYFVFTILFTLLFSSCTKEPWVKIACVPDRDVNVFGVGESIHFTTKSTDAYDFHWSFGDGSTSQGLGNAYHTYSTPGNTTFRSLPTAKIKKNRLRKPST